MSSFPFRAKGQHFSHYHLAALCFRETESKQRFALNVSMARQGKIK